MSEQVGSLGFKCPECGNGTYVVDSRPTLTAIRRRRECRKCGKRFSTHEILLPDGAKARKDFLKKIHRWSEP